MTFQKTSSPSCADLRIEREHSSGLKLRTTSRHKQALWKQLGIGSLPLFRHLRLRLCMSRFGMVDCGGVMKPLACPDQAMNSIRLTACAPQKPGRVSLSLHVGAQRSATYNQTRSICLGLTHCSLGFTPFLSWPCCQAFLSH